MPTSRGGHVHQGVTLDGRRGDGLGLLELDELFDQAAAVAATGRADSRSLSTWLAEFSGPAGSARPSPGGVRPALELARRIGSVTPWPGRGDTVPYFETLATLAAADVTVARVIEPHLDALAILDECPQRVDLATLGADRSSTWGVFAAEGPGLRLDAVPDAHGWTLRGTKPWCSLAGELTHALVTAHVADPPGDSGDDGAGRSERRLFAVALGVGGVTVHPEAWVARGFPDVPSGPVDFDEVPAVPVGEAGWYLERAGFEWGGIGVAAAWFGGAVGVGRRVMEAAAQRGDDIGALHAGRCASALLGARAVLASAAAQIDAGGSTGVDAAILAQGVRSTVRAACETVLGEAAEALGPAPLALDAGYAARVADLGLYLRQDHGARDEVRLGRLLIERRDLLGRGTRPHLRDDESPDITSREEHRR